MNVTRAIRIGAGALLLQSSIVYADIDVCQQPDDYSRVSVGYYRQDPSTLDASAAEIGREDQQVDLHFKLNDTWSLGLAHRYVILDVAPIELQTNGHLHTVSVPLHRQSRTDGKGFRFSVAPTLSASSNVMKEPGEFSADTFQLLAAMVWSKDLSNDTTLRYGVCADHRFGAYAIYPALSIAWRPHPEWLIEAGFPVTRMSYRVSGDVSMSLRIAPDGNEWHVKSRDRTRQSQLVYEALQVRWALRWQAMARLGVTVDVARLFRGRYDVALQDDSRVRLAQQSATRLGAAVEWRF